VGARDGILDFFKVSSDKRTTANLNKVTVGLMGIVTLLAAKLTDLGLVASVGGATFGTALVFVYPTIMFMRLMKQKGTKTNESKLAGLIAVMGVIMGAIGTAMALKGVEV
jgi:sodium-coupled neutral amino acid transporter 11